MSVEHEKGLNSLIEVSKHHFIQTVAEGTPIYAYYPEHIEQVEQWVLRILPHYPDADSEIVLLAVQLHDIGHADGKYWEDHAVKSEKETIRFLTGHGYPEDKINQVAHCVRAHRCRDVMPDTIEAQILVAADSASHLTDFVYIVMLGQDHLTREDILQKLERDYGDCQNWLPENFGDEITALYKAWRELIMVLPK